MEKINKLSVILIFLVLINLLSIENGDEGNRIKHVVDNSLLPIATPIPQPPLPTEKLLRNNGYHVFQTFNNCGPASLSMALSFYGISISQKVLGDELRPYQVINGDNDDKSVTLSELAEKSKDFNLMPIHRPNGDIETLKRFIANDMPVIVRTWTTPNEDIGHFRVIKGYNENSSTLIQDDSLQGKDLEYKYSDFDVIWKKFNYEYLALVPKEKLEIVNQILGGNIDEEVAWRNAISESLNQLAIDPNDIYTRFNLSVAYYKVNDYERSVVEFEKIENQLPFRTLWYQIEPILAYYNLGNYDKVLKMTDSILNNGNRAFSELYIIRGDIYKQLGQIEKSNLEYEKAVFYKSPYK